MSDNTWIEINKKRGKRNIGTSSVSDIDMFRLLASVQSLNVPIQPTLPSVYQPWRYVDPVSQDNNTYITSWSEEDEKKEETHECCICKEKITLEDNRKKLSCGHKFHGRCLGEWILEKRQCPVCRRNLILTRDLE